MLILLLRGAGSSLVLTCIKSECPGHARRGGGGGGSGGFKAKNSWWHVKRAQL